MPLYVDIFKKEARAVESIANNEKPKSGMHCWGNDPLLIINGTNQLTTKYSNTIPDGAATVSDPINLTIKGMLVIGSIIIINTHAH